MAPELLELRYTESVVDQTDHFDDSLFAKTNVTPFESLQPISFCLEKSSVRKCLCSVLSANDKSYLI